MIIKDSDTLKIPLTSPSHHYRLSQLYRTLNLSFASPLHRATPYLFGVGFAVLVYNSDLSTRLPKALNIMGWTTAIASIVWCFYAPAHLAYKDYVYEPTEVADYAAWAPLMWSIALCWIVYVCCVKSSGKHLASKKTKKGKH